MRLRVLAALIPVVVLVAACSGSATTAARTYASGSSAAAAATPTAGPTVAPTSVASVAPSVEPWIEPSAEPRSGEIQVVMTDAMRFEPDPIAVKAGEPITFVVKNDGVIVHEFFVGTAAEQDEHAAEMAAGGGSHGHDNALTLEGGKSGSLTMTFADAGSLLIGCHEPGHYQAGMKATLTIAD